MKNRSSVKKRETVITEYPFGTFLNRLRTSGPISIYPDEDDTVLMTYSERKLKVFLDKVAIKKKQNIKRKKIHYIKIILIMKKY